MALIFSGAVLLCSIAGICAIFFMMAAAMLLRKLFDFTYGMLRALFIRRRGIHLLQLCNGKIFSRAEIVVMGTVPDLPGYCKNICGSRGMMGIQQRIHRFPDLSQHSLFRISIAGLYGNGYQAVRSQISLTDHFIQKQMDCLFPGLAADIHILQDRRAVVIIGSSFQNKAITVQRKRDRRIHIHIHIGTGSEKGKAPYEQENGKSGANSCQPLPVNPAGTVSLACFRLQIVCRFFLQAVSGLDFVKGIAKLIFHSTHLPAVS